MLPGLEKSEINNFHFCEKIKEIETDIYIGLVKDLSYYLINDCGSICNDYITYKFLTFSNEIDFSDFLRSHSSVIRSIAINKIKNKSNLNLFLNDPSSKVRKTVIESMKSNLSMIEFLYDKCPLVRLAVIKKIMLADFINKLNYKQYNDLFERVCECITDIYLPIRIYVARNIRFFKKIKQNKIKELLSKKDIDNNLGIGTFVYGFEDENELVRVYTAESMTVLSCNHEIATMNFEFLVDLLNDEMVLVKETASICMSLVSSKFTIKITEEFLEQIFFNLEDKHNKIRENLLVTIKNLKYDENTLLFLLNNLENKNNKINEYIIKTIEEIVIYNKELSKILYNKYLNDESYNNYYWFNFFKKIKNNEIMSLFNGNNVSENMLLHNEKNENMSLFNEKDKSENMLLHNEKNENMSLFNEKDKSENMLLHNEKNENMSLHNEKDKSENMQVDHDHKNVTNTEPSSRIFIQQKFDSNVELDNLYSKEQEENTKRPKLVIQDKNEFNNKKDFDNSKKEFERIDNKKATEYNFNEEKKDKINMNLLNIGYPSIGIIQSSSSVNIQGITEMNQNIASPSRETVHYSSPVNIQGNTEINQNIVYPSTGTLQNRALTDLENIKKSNYNDKSQIFQANAEEAVQYSTLINIENIKQSNQKQRSYYTETVQSSSPNNFKETDDQESRTLNFVPNNIHDNNLEDFVNDFLNNFDIFSFEQKREFFNSYLSEFSVHSLPLLQHFCLLFDIIFTDQLTLKEIADKITQFSRKTIKIEGSPFIHQIYTLPLKYDIQIIGLWDFTDIFLKVNFNPKVLYFRCFQELTIYLYEKDLNCFYVSLIKKYNNIEFNLCKTIKVHVK